MNYDKLYRKASLILGLAILLVQPVGAQTFTECTDEFGSSARIVDFEGITSIPGQAGAVDLVGDEYPLVFLTAGPGADGLFVGIPDPSIPGGNNANFFAADFFPVSPTAVFSPDKDPSPGSPSPDGQLIVDFPRSTNGVGGYFLDPEGFPSRIEAFDGPGGTGTSLGFEVVQNQPDNSQTFASVKAAGIRSAVLTLGGGGDGVGLDDLCFGAPTSSVLCAGQHLDAGTVSVSNDDDTLFVQFDTNPGWMLLETHVAVACDPDDLPQTKTGNPKVGHFPYSMEHDPWLTTYAEAIDLDFGCSPLYIAAHAVVGETLAQAPYYANWVEAFSQGPLQGGGTVLPSRSDPTNALVPDYTGGATTFFSLGFGGSIVVGFDCPIVNRSGDDVAVWEVTNGTYPPESVEVWASQDGMTWTLLGNADNGRTFPQSSGSSSTQTDLDLGALAWASYLQIVDVTDPNDFVGRPDADAFDLDGIASLQDCILDETAWGDACDADGEPSDTGIPFPGSNWATYFEYTPLVD